MSLEALSQALASEEPEERRRAVAALALRGGEEAIELFVRALGDGDWRVRKEASALSVRVTPRASLLVRLAQSLDDKTNIGLRNAAVEALVNIGPDAVSSVLGALDALDADARKLAVEVLAGVPDPRGVARLIEALADPDANVVLAAAEALGRAGLATERTREDATAALLSHLESEDLALAHAVLDALVRLDANLPSSRLLPLAERPLMKRATLSAAAKAKDEAALAFLVNAVVETPGAREAILALAGWLRELTPDSAFVVAAGAMIRRAPAVHEALRKTASESSEAELAEGALVALGAARDPTDVPGIVHALEGEGPSSGALRALELFGPEVALSLATLLDVAAPALRVTLLELIVALATELDARALRAVRETLSDASAEVVAAAANVLGSFGDERDLGRLVALTAHGDGRIAEAASSSLTSLAARHRATARALLAALDPTAEHAAAGAAIVAAMTRVGSGSEQPPVAELMAFGERALRSADPRARRLAVEALAESGAEEAPERIAVALADEEQEVRLAAVRALGRVGAESILRGIVVASTDEETVSSALRALASASLPAALELAEAHLGTAPPALASTAVEIFALATGEARTRGLLLALGHRDRDVVTLALSELAGSLTPELVGKVAPCLAHPAWEVRRLASEIFAELRIDAARALLRDRFEVEREPEVRAALAEALSLRPPRFEGG
ncbi:MAG: HEAT repeat domain-containing protein [Myxococcales bacterium]|nr:HEAT repeat domain-containing protein [Myxococcales bacterium]